jgi:hypothetical protein
MNGSERPPIPHPPYDELRSASDAHPEAGTAIDELHAELHEPEPRTERIAQSVQRLRTIPVLEAQIANWWDAPRTQQWLKILSDAGL